MDVQDDPKSGFVDKLSKSFPLEVRERIWTSLVDGLPAIHLKGERVKDKRYVGPPRTLLILPSRTPEQYKDVVAGKRPRKTNLKPEIDEFRVADNLFGALSASSALKNEVLRTYLRSAGAMIRSSPYPIVKTSSIWARHSDLCEWVTTLFFQGLDCLVDQHLDGNDRYTDQSPKYLKSTTWTKVTEIELILDAQPPTSPATCSSSFVNSMLETIAKAGWSGLYDMANITVISIPCTLPAYLGLYGRESAALEPAILKHVNHYIKILSAFKTQFAAKNKVVEIKLWAYGDFRRNLPADRSGMWVITGPDDIEKVW